MEKQVAKYLSKLLAHGLIRDRGDASLFGLDDEIYSNAGAVPEEVRKIFSLLNINSLLIAKPDPAYWSIISRLTGHGTACIRPRDCESLTFIHDIPVVPTMDPVLTARALTLRKGCIVKDAGIVTSGTVSLEQAFVTMSSICFATFVKFFADALNSAYGYGDAPETCACPLDDVNGLLEQAVLRTNGAPLNPEAPASEEEIIKAIIEAGSAVVQAGLVDSFFGNISYRLGDAVYISQTGSSLDELGGYIDRVTMDGSTTCEITSSSELLAHVRTYELTGDTAILHGHPRFSVIMSMFGEALGFGDKRSIEGIPVVSGEVGAGKHGLCNTLPPAMQESHCAIVSGHGTFTSCRGSFREAFEKLSAIEHTCRQAYREALEKAPSR